MSTQTSKVITIDPTWIKGIDTDHYIGTIDASKVANSGIAFIIAKATQGTGFTDPQFAHTWAAAGKAGVIRGSYHFYEAGVDPVAQANHYAAVLKANGGIQSTDLPWCVDVEYDSISAKKYKGTRAQLITDLHKFIDALPKDGRAILFYTSPAFIEEWLDKSFTSTHLWIAKYAANPPASVLPWSDWCIWQKSPGEEGGHTVPGVPSSVDVNLFHGTKAALVAKFGLKTKAK